MNEMNDDERELIQILEKELGYVVLNATENDSSTQYQITSFWKYFKPKYFKSTRTTFYRKVKKKKKN